MVNGSGWHEYRLFGLFVRSCLALPAPPVAHWAEPDRAGSNVLVEITYGSVPSQLGHTVVSVPWMQVAPRVTLLIIDRVARYLIADGRRVVIERFPGAADEHVRAFLLGTALAALLMQRHDLVLHGSAVDVKGAVGFLGVSGSGKSTLAAALHCRGFHVLADDLCVIRAGVDGTEYIHPGLSRVKLLPDAVSSLGIASDAFEPVSDVGGKRTWSIAARPGQPPVPLRKLYVLDSTTDGPPIAPLSGARKIRALRAHTFRFRLVEGLGLGPHHFDQVRRLARSIPMAMVRRSACDGGAGPIADAVVADALGPP